MRTPPAGRTMRSSSEPADLTELHAGMRALTERVALSAPMGRRRVPKAPYVAHGPRGRGRAVGTRRAHSPAGVDGSSGLSRMASSVFSSELGGTATAARAVCRACPVQGECRCYPPNSG